MEFGSGILPRSTLLLLSLLQEEKNILFRLQEIKLLHGSKVDSDVAVFCKDTDVLILMIWAYSKLNITNNWYLKYDHEKFADIRKICSYLGKTLSLNLQKIQALTGYNTTSYFYWVGKIKAFNKLHDQHVFYMFSIVRVRKLLSNYQQRYWIYQGIH